MTKMIRTAAGQKGSRRRRTWLLVLSALLTVATMIPFMSGASAVHDDLTFELDKNASNDTDVTWLAELASQVRVGDASIRVCQFETPPPAPFTILVEAERMTVTATADANFGGQCAGAKRTYTVTRGAGGTTAVGHSASGVSARVSLIEEDVIKAGPDWDEVYAQVLADPLTTCESLGLVECSYVYDGIGPSTFIGGASKDHLPIDGWQHTTGASPDKAEILSAYAAKALDPDSGNELLYFGMDRYAVDGSTDIGFWFFKNPVVQNADGTFTGEHAGTPTENGDILILGTFTQGGATSNIRVFRWVGTGGNESGTIQGPDAAFSDCVPGSANDNGCATVNNTSIEVDWTYQFKGADQGSWIPAGGFLEGGVDLTALGLEGCFSSFLAETRSSPEITAILKDFVLGDFEACETSLTTTPANGTGVALTDSGTNGIPDISIGTGSVSVTDLAALDVKGVSTWGGTLAFSLCGPLASSTATCDTGGTLIDSQTVSELTVQPITSLAATVTSAGRYCWRGDFTPNSATAALGVEGASDSSLGECFEVLPVTASISTVASGTVVIGNPISDTANLSGTANMPGTPVINPSTPGAGANGTITFNLYGPDDNACSGTPVFTATANVTGNGAYSSGNFTPTAAGTYRWVASYSGDSPNTIGKSGACNDANESVVVTPKQPAIVTNATAGPVPLGSAISDTATLSNTSPKPNSLPAGGTITFKVYGPDDTSCSGTVVFTSTVNVTGNGTYGSGNFTPTAAGTYRWIASYSGDSPNTLPVSGSCNDANESSLVIQLQPAISTAQSFVPNDAATITVASGGGDLAGSVVFQMFVDDPTCAGTAAYTSSPIDITTGTGTGLSRTVMSANTVAYTADAEFYWVVTYTSTNTGHKNVTSACGTEISMIEIYNNGLPPSP